MNDEQRRFEDYLATELQALRSDMRELSSSVGQLLTVDEKLELHRRVNHLERWKWSVPATALLAIVVAIVGG